MRKGISQEGLKVIACITMLIDHIGYALVYPVYQQTLLSDGVGDAAWSTAEFLYTIYLMLRVIGRLSLPIFAFLLVEGFCHTYNRKNMQYVC